MIKVLLLSVLFLSHHFANSNTTTSFIITGVVLNEEKKPVQKLHLYTVMGEEEAVSDARGEFSLKTYQPARAKLVADGRDYKKK